MNKGHGSVGIRSILNVKVRERRRTRYSSNVIATAAGTALFPYKKKSEDGIPASQGNGFEDLGTPVDEELPF